MCIDDLDGRRQLVGIDPDEHLRHAYRLCSRTSGIARRALLLRAGQSPLEPHLAAANDGTQTEGEPHQEITVGSRKESTPPNA